MLSAQRLSASAQAPQSRSVIAKSFTRSSPRPLCSSSSRSASPAASRRAATSGAVSGAGAVPRRHLLAAGSGLLTAAAAVGRRSGVVMAAAAAAAAGSDSSHDLLIVGPGVLGSYLGVLWREAFPGSSVTAQTNTTNSHDRLREMGLQPVTRDDAPAGKKYPYVLFAAPPSGSEDYPGAVAAAAQQWDGSGSFVFTSSMSVCATDDGGEVSENCPLVPQGKSPSTDRLLGAESAALSAGGNVLRLVGLYHAGRGPHTFFIKMGEVARYSGYTVNMLHYEDAARLALSILRGDGSSSNGSSDGGSSGGYRGKIFVGTDGHPLTFQEMVDACFESGLFGSGSVKFTGTPETGGLGKVVLNETTRQQLGGWVPKYESFKSFFLQNKGQDYYNSGAKTAVGAPHQ